MTTPPVSALVMLSGGLDSMLAAAVLKAQGIAVTALSFETPFFSATKAREAAEQLRIPIIIEDFADTLVGIIEHPKHGFGSQINPCIDCHAAMIRRAGVILQRDGFSFVATGEVLNQRPMSQTKRSLTIVADDSGLKDRLVRPLSAKLLPETEPERLGWVDRSRLLSLSGRGRKPQYALAKEYGITKYPSSAGGCKLTEPHFAERLWDLRRNNQLRDFRAINLLRWGRHFRLSSTVKVIVGREASDNAGIKNLALPEEPLLDPVVVSGPLVLITGPAKECDIEMAARLCARYGDGRNDATVLVAITTPAGRREMSVAPASELDVERLKI